MRHLGIDYGTKKVGLALSDEGGTMAFPHEVIPNTSDLMKYVEHLIEKQNVGAIVIGHSRDGRGKDNAVQEDIEAFMLDLTLVTGLPVHLEPEAYSTQEAMRIQGRTEKTDASAAAIILNSYLTRTRNA